jgi:DNA repair protein RadC
MDQDLTDHFIQAGKFLNVEVIDHLIISEKAYYSFLDSGLFAKLQESKKYVLPYELEERARKEGLEEGLEIGEEKGVKKGKKEKAIEMAKSMKHKGIDHSIIKEISGLSIKEIQEL